MNDCQNRIEKIIPAPIRIIMIPSAIKTILDVLSDNLVLSLETKRQIVTHQISAPTTIPATQSRLSVNVPLPSIPKIENAMKNEAIRTGLRIATTNADRNVLK